MRTQGSIVGAAHTVTRPMLLRAVAGHVAINFSTFEDLDEAFRVVAGAKGVLECLLGRVDVISTRVVRFKDLKGIEELHQGNALVWCVVFVHVHLSEWILG
jgi:hypothetical protein